MESPQQEIRDDLHAHDHTMSIPIRQVVRELCDMLGATTVAVIGGVRETRAVQQWMGDREPQRPNVLRFALQVAIMIATERDGEIARAWFHGANPRLDDRVPMLMLRDLPLAEVQAQLLRAARSFAARNDGPSMNGHT
jgi:hypothetical protein